MKILHTADWHIGKTLHKYPLQDQLILFFEWLHKLIKEESVDLLLISGDVFDLANPSAKDRELYYQLLRRLNSLNLKVVITGGNHDSVGLLNAPKEVLQALNITVVGGATEDLAEELIEVKDSDGNIELIVAAVPFLRDKDLRHRETEDQYENRTEAIREGIKHHYAQLTELAEQKYPGIPALAMGHLYTIGADPSDSERDIHIGNTAAVDASAFTSYFGYVALGHIHRPQVIGKNEFIRYSGSPIPLSFSEKGDKKTVIILELEDGTFTSPRPTPVPAFRELKKISGTEEEVRNKLDQYRPDFQLPSFVEVEVKETTFNSVIIGRVEEIKADYEENGRFSILKTRTFFESGAKDTADLFEEEEHIEDLSPKDVFVKKMEAENLETETAAMLLEAFQELMENAEGGSE